MYHDGGSDQKRIFESPPKSTDSYDTSSQAVTVRRKPSSYYPLETDTSKSAVSFLKRNFCMSYSDGSFCSEGLRCRLTMGKYMIMMI